MLLTNEQRSIVRIKRTTTKGHPSKLKALQEKGRGLTEYGVLLGLVVLCFFLFFKTVNLEQAVTDIFNRVDSVIMQFINGNNVNHPTQ